ncbi:7902_t:CDS:1, partial [Funneliformis geosporum]
WLSRNLYFPAAFPPQLVPHAADIVVGSAASSFRHGSSRVKLFTGS